MRHDRESANLPFGADNLKLTWCNFKSSASAAAEKTTREIPCVMVCFAAPQKIQK